MVVIHSKGQVHVAIGAARAADEIHEGKVTAVGDDKITVLDNRDDNNTFVVTAATTRPRA